MPPRPDPDLVLVGVFGAAVGLKGEVRIRSYTGEPADIGEYGPLLTDDGRRFTILSLRPQKDMLVARIEGVTDRTAAEALVNRRLYVPREALGTVDGEEEFFHADLIGLAAVTAQGDAVGTVVALHDFGAGDIVELTPPGGGTTFYLPFTHAVVPVIDLAGRRMIVEPPAETETGEARPDAR